ncbi:hypothetical protein HAX54_032776 [Datura stramonium]|uniref:Uncharacterized protein n=1 Tax=Datura stramonium TaxID=4076 RepID=A0ABS8VF02_DATST|nr:hypothetical protein [Datura stramonium]
MEREARPKVDENMEREIRNIKEAFKSIQSFAKSIAAQVLDEIAEDNLVEGLKNLFIAEEEAECNVILKDCVETPTIWDAKTGDALNNWTCTPSSVLRESW